MQFVSPVFLLATVDNTNTGQVSRETAVASVVVRL